MGHVHNIIDADAHFIIDPITRAIKNQTPNKVKLIQGDHNCERFSFEMPRLVEGHDMTKCNLVQVHYNNIDAGTREENKGVYEINDMQVDGNNIVFSWLITENVTKYVGGINFLIVFKCTTGEVVDYKWHTDINSEISISSGMDNTETVTEPFPDILAQWKAELFEAGGNAVVNVNVAKEEAIEAVQEAGRNITEATEIAKADLSNKLANAIKVMQKGEILKIDDVSTVEHELAVKVHGKNFFDVSKITNTATATNNGDGSITISANTYYCRLEQTLREVCPQLEAGKICVLSFETGSSAIQYMYFHGLQATWNVGNYITMTDDILDSYVTVYGYAENDEKYGQENIIYNIQIEEGRIATEYTPYVDPTTINVQRCGKNLFDCLNAKRILGHSNISSQTKNSITVTGPATTWQSACFALPKILEGKKITISGNWKESGENKGCLRVQWVNNVGTTLGDIVAITNTSGMKATGIVPNKPEGALYLCLFVYSNSDGSGVLEGDTVTYTNIQVEVGAEATDFEEYKEITDHTPTTDGTVEGVKSLSPNMTILTDINGVVIECEYNIDTKTYIDKKIEELRIALSGE